MANGFDRVSCGITVLRVVVGIVFFVHGLQKMFGFGFYGVTGFMGSVGIPLPNVAAVIVTLVELIGGFALIIGLLTRWAAILNGFDMIVATLLVHWKNGFFMQKQGYEFTLTLLAACVALVLAGPGCFSIDRAISRRD